jgi:hypothetical protein
MKHVGWVILSTLGFIVGYSALPFLGVGEPHSLETVSGATSGAFGAFVVSFFTMPTRKNVGGN